jgi:lysyl-tRNA synthetase, class I
VGGSFDTAKAIVKELWGRNPPSYLMYDFVTLKGLGGKLSSSKGNVIRLQDVLEIYTPEIVRFLFAGTRPGSEFAIPFDDNVLKVYEDFDAIERIYYGKSDASEKDKANAYRIYEMSMLSKDNISDSMPIQPSFRQLAMLSQIYELDSESILGHFDTDNDYDRRRIILRAERAFRWSRNYAPESWRYSKNDSVPASLSKSLDDKSKKAFALISEQLYEDIFEEDAGSIVKAAISESGTNPKEFFRLAYLLLLNNEKGPRLSQILASFPLYSKRLFKEASR